MTASLLESDAPLARLAVLGLGLLGGSVALAARERGVARCVVGAGRPGTRLDPADWSPLVEKFLEPSEAVRGADLVLLATPVGAMPQLVEEVAAHLEEGAIVTDVGSVKGLPAELLPGLLPPGVCYVGSHPMAGSHRRGRNHARADLFEGAGCAVAPLPGVDPRAVARVAAFWTALGARVVIREPAVHDSEVAWVSHLPHALAFAFARSLAAAPAAAGELSGAGFRDFTRIAKSDAELWADILCANRKALSGPIQECLDALSELAAAVEAGDGEAVENFLSAARISLSTVSDRSTERGEEICGAKSVRSGGDHPDIRADSNKRRSAHPRRNNNNS